MMLALALLAAVPSDLMAKADRANEAYVQCMFAVSRNASQARLSAAEFEARLTRSCLAEQRVTREIGIRIFTLRGNRDPAGTADGLIRQTREQLIAQYRKAPEIERSLEQLAEICRTRPKACAD
ncbi:MAG: hypothetical protein ABIO43_01615 [Sphingomicrobium sp.]